MSIFLNNGRYTINSKHFISHRKLKENDTTLSFLQQALNNLLNTMLSQKHVNCLQKAWNQPDSGIRIQYLYLTKSQNHSDLTHALRILKC